MVIQNGARFQQFIHSKFRENIIRVLYVPTRDGDSVFMVVNKHGGVGLYDPAEFSILHTYALDLSVPMKPDMSHGVEQIAKQASCPPTRTPSSSVPPKCQRTHLVADAIYAPDVNSVFFATTKNILQLYDLGDIESLSFGLEIFPRQKLLKLRAGRSPVVSRNRGHVETHRVFGHTDSAPFYCMEYVPTPSSPASILPSSSAERDASTAKLIIGDKAGLITIITIRDHKKPFGKSKARGELHKILFSQLERDGLLQKYQAHHRMIQEICWVPSRQLIISCSRDTKFSLFIKDYTESIEPYIISLQKGVNTFAHNDSLKLIATGSDDCIVRLFNQYVMKMPQMELEAHTSPIIGLEFLQLPFSDKPLLISYSTDTELRVWDPLDFVCLQSVHVSFPIHSEITASKTPEFGRKSLIIHQPHYNVQKLTEAPPTKNDTDDENQATTTGTKISKPVQPSSRSRPPISRRPNDDGFVLVLYCNAYARLMIEKDTTYWPFDFDDFVNEFQDAKTSYEKKIRDRQAAYAESKYRSKDPNVLKLSPEEIAGIESKLDSYVKDIIKIKRNADKQLRSAIYNPDKEALAGETTRKFLQLQTRSQNSELLRKDGIRTVFKFVPLYDLDNVEFSSVKEGQYNGLSGGPHRKHNNSGLPTTSIMREGGIGRISSAFDLLTPTARKFFNGERFKSAQFEAAVTSRTATERFERWGYSSKQLKSNHPEVFATSSSSIMRDFHDHNTYAKSDKNELKKNGHGWKTTEVEFELGETAGQELVDDDNDE